MKILELKNVTKYLNWNKILSEVSFEVEKWDIYGFLWPNWAWKTTTMKCILWLIEPEEWEIKIFWEKWLSIKSKEKIWFMPENTYLYRHLTWAEFLRFNGKFFDIDSKELEKKIEHLLKKVWLNYAWNKRLSDYSKWMLQRIWLAQSIINDPKLLFLDEPMSWLDPIGRKMVKDLLLDLKEDWTTIFFNTHILADAESMCNKISIIHKWKIIIESKKVKDIEEDLEKFFIHHIEKSSN
jgi:ABC-2 type transport system ATP-binding protein